MTNIREVSRVTKYAAQAKRIVYTTARFGSPESKMCSAELI